MPGLWGIGRWWGGRRCGRNTYRVGLTVSVIALTLVGTAAHAVAAGAGGPGLLRHRPLRTTRRCVGSGRARGVGGRSAGRRRRDAAGRPCPCRGGRPRGRCPGGAGQGPRCCGGGGDGPAPLPDDPGVRRTGRLGREPRAPRRAPVGPQGRSRRRRRHRDPRQRRAEDRCGHAARRRHTRCRGDRRGARLRIRPGPPGPRGGGDLRGVLRRGLRRGVLSQRHHPPDRRRRRRGRRWSRDPRHRDRHVERHRELGRRRTSGIGGRDQGHRQLLVLGLLLHVQRDHRRARPPHRPPRAGGGHREHEPRNDRRSSPATATRRPRG